MTTTDRRCLSRHEDTPKGPVSASGYLTLPPPVGAQQEVLYLPADGHTVVIGTAGSGKTTMSLHRAFRVGEAQLGGDSKTCIITFNRSLRNWMSTLVDGYDVPPAMNTFHGWARHVLEAGGDSMDTYLFNRDKMISLTSLAYMRTRNQMGSRPVFKRHPKFFFDELDWIEGMGIETLAEYIETTRMGQSKTKLNSDGKEGVWAVRETYRELRSDAGYDFDLRDIATKVLSTPEVAQATPYQHVVIDEGQDLTPQMLRAIAKAMPETGSITFFGDPTQQIYGNQMSWKSAGFMIRKTWAFDTNYRNTKQIAALAREIVAEVSDVSLGELPARSGPKPRLVRFASDDEENAAIAACAEDSARHGFSVAILARSKAAAQAVAREVSTCKVQLSRDLERFDQRCVFWGTVHSAKGFEFDEVFVVGLDDSSWPDPTAVQASGEEDALDQDTKLLYVAATRARTLLTLSYVRAATDLLPTRNDLYDHQ